MFDHDSRFERNMNRASFTCRATENKLRTTHVTFRSCLEALRRLERVFRCYIVCETKDDYKEGCLLVWANYMSPCNSIFGLYIEGTCDVIPVTMATHKVQKRSTKFQFL